MGLEAGHLGLGPEVVAVGGLERVVRGQLLAHVPELLEVAHGVVLGVLAAEGGEAAGPAAAGHQVAPLDRLGQGEESPRGGVGAVHVGLPDGVPRHLHEARVAEAVPQHPDELGALLRAAPTELGQVDGLDLERGAGHGASGLDRP
jgi:hypothetical protein